MLASMTGLRTSASLEQIIQRLETIHRALSAGTESGCDPRLAEAVAGCLRELHAIAAQSADEARRLRLIAAATRLLH
jgi:hypothetical protein